MDDVNITREDFKDLKDRISKIEEAIVTLARIEERVLNQQKQIEGINNNINRLWDEVRKIKGSIASLPWVERIIWIAITGVIAWLSRKL